MCAGVRVGVRMDVSMDVSVSLCIHLDSPLSGRSRDSVRSEREVGRVAAEEADEEPEDEGRLLERADEASTGTFLLDDGGGGVLSPCSEIMSSTEASGAGSSFLAGVMKQKREG